MSIMLPVEPDDPNQEFTTSIEDVQYLFAFRFNERDRNEDGSTDGSWYMDIRESNGDPIALGVKVVVGMYLAAWSPHRLFLRGVFVAHDMAGDMLDPSFKDLGRRIQVVYFSNTELVAQVLAL